MFIIPFQQGQAHHLSCPVVQTTGRGNTGWKVRRTAETITLNGRTRRQGTMHRVVSGISEVSVMLRYGSMGRQEGPGLGPVPAYLGH